MLLRCQHGLQAQQALLCGGPLCRVQRPTLSHQVGGVLGALVRHNGGAQVATHRPLSCAWWEGEDGGSTGAQMGHGERGGHLVW